MEIRQLLIQHPLKSHSYSTILPNVHNWILQYNEPSLGMVQSSYSTCTATQCNKLNFTWPHPLLQRAMSQAGVSTLSLEGGELSHRDKKYYIHLGQLSYCVTKTTTNG